MPWPAGVRSAHKRAGHMRARSRPRRSRRVCALRISERDTHVLAHVPAVAGGFAHGA